jgi:transposase
MFVALEPSKSSWLVALHSPVADKVSMHRFVGGDVAGLLTQIDAGGGLARPDDPGSVLLRGGV